MFTKKKRVGSAGIYRDVIDWQAVGIAVIVVIVLLAAASNA